MHLHAGMTGISEFSSFPHAMWVIQCHPDVSQLGGTSTQEGCLFGHGKNK